MRKHEILHTLYCSCFQSDMAVGCPYGGDDQQGLVLIYNGYAEGLKDTPTQTLSGQWASSSFPASFGFALRGNKDLDQNGYPGSTRNIPVRDLYTSLYLSTSLNSLSLLADLIVGAFGTDKVVLYRYV